MTHWRCIHRHPYHPLQRVIPCSCTSEPACKQHCNGRQIIFQDISTNYGIYILDDLYYSKCRKAVGTAKLYWRKPFTRETLRAPVDFGVLDTRRRRENQRKPSKPCCGHNRCTGEIWKPQQKYRNSMYLSILSWLKMIIHDYIYAVIDFSGWVICLVIGVHIYRSYLMMVICIISQLCSHLIELDGLKVPALADMQHHKTIYKYKYYNTIKSSPQWS